MRDDLNTLNGMPILRREGDSHFLRYNPYQVEISWTVPLLDLNEGFLHTSSFAVQEC